MGNYIWNFYSPHGSQNTKYIQRKPKKKKKEHFKNNMQLCPGCQAGQTPLSIADRLGYISVVEILRHVTEVTVTTPTDGERYKVMSPEMMQEAAISDVEGDDEGLRSCLCSCFMLLLVCLCAAFVQRSRAAGFPP